MMVVSVADANFGMAGVSVVTGSGVSMTAACGMTRVSVATAVCVPVNRQPVASCWRALTVATCLDIF